MAKGISPLIIPKLSKIAQEKEDKLKKKLYEVDKCWNDCKFQL